jgi:hypothetical protein
VTYVEWLRVRRVLIWTGGVMVALLLLLAAIRIMGCALLSSSSPLAGVTIGGVKGETVLGATPNTQSMLADGTRRTVYDDAKDGVRITVDDRGYRGKHVEVFATRPAAIAVSSDSGFQGSAVAGGELYRYDSDQPEDLSSHIIAAGIVALIVATLLGAPFARENDGHLEIALSKPISRTKLGLEIVLADLTGVVAAWVMTMLFLFAAHAIVEAPQHAYAPYDTALALLTIVGAFAWYAMLCAATASMKRAYGAVQGVAWPACGVILLLANVSFGTSQLAQLVHWVATPISWLVPFTFLGAGFVHTFQGAQGSSAMDPYTSSSVLLLLAIVYGAIAIYQWRRVEA